MIAVDDDSCRSKNYSMSTKRKKPEHGKRLEQRRKELSYTTEDVVGRANDVIQGFIDEDEYAHEKPHETNKTMWNRLEMGDRAPNMLKVYEIKAIAEALQWSPQQLADALDIALPKSLRDEGFSSFFHQSVFYGDKSEISIIKAYDARYDTGMSDYPVPTAFLKNRRMNPKRAFLVVVRDELFMDEWSRREFAPFTELWCVLSDESPQEGNIAIVEVPGYTDKYGVYYEQGQSYITLACLEPNLKPVVIERSNVKVVAVLAFDVRPRLKNLDSLEPL